MVPRKDGHKVSDPNIIGLRQDGSPVYFVQPTAEKRAVIGWMIAMRAIGFGFVSAWW